VFAVQVAPAADIPRLGRGPAAVNGPHAADVAVISVRHTAELDRILALPRRPPTCPAGLIEEMTAALKRNAGTQTLLPVQAWALFEALTQSGLLGNIDVGEGKTLISFLIAYVLEATSFVLIIPSNLIEKTRIEHAAYAKHWHVTPLEEIEIVSYEELSRVSAESLLDELAPDLICCDEVHRFKDRGAACTRRMVRYMKANPETRFIGLSGTLMQKSVRDFGHVLRWALRDGAPIPRTEAELEDWAWALDDKLPEDARWHPGALLSLCAERPPDNATSAELVTAARLGFQRRLLETPGVVSTLGDAERVRCPIYISAVAPAKYNQTTEVNFERLRNTWTLPDGWELDSASDVWRHAREMALGFYYVWDPRPPDEWLEARREWNGFVSGVLEHSRTLDSEEHIARAVDAGRLQDGGKLARWRKIRSTYKINQRAVWFDDAALRYCAEWMRKHPDGIVWVEHVAFGERLAQMTRCKYYGADGRAADGELLTADSSPGRAVIASIKANKEGRNLQTRASNLITSMQDSADVCQQQFGRTHRRGQTADQVTFEIFLSCLEHANSFRHAMSGAAALRDTLGARPKLLLADLDWPTDRDIASRRGARWQRRI
jgi:hypothetical protein